MAYNRYVRDMYVIVTLCFECYVCDMYVIVTLRIERYVLLTLQQVFVECLCGALSRFSWSIPYDAVKRLTLFSVIQTGE